MPRVTIQNATVLSIRSATPKPGPLSLALFTLLLGAMNRIAAVLLVFCAISLLAPQPASAIITIDTVPVGNAGNANDPATGSLYGGVGKAYNIGKYEVTVGQYTAFLNAVGATDTYFLYNPAMATDLTMAGISRSGVSGSYSYSVIGSANHPISYVSWGDAARFDNWLHNGQPTGAQVLSTTEDGAYFLNGATSDLALSFVSRKAGAQWFIPSENEWYKAAYHKNDGPTSNYWTYPTGTNNEPNSDQPPGDPSIQTNAANFFRDDGLANGYNDGYAVSGSTNFPSGNALTDAGAYTSAPSPYGTFDQGGNVYEWNEALISDSFRGLRGSSFLSPSDELQSSSRDYSQPTNEYSHFGFRVASSVPEPGTLVLAGIGAALIGLGAVRRRRHAAAGV